jgi:hypothetical protein
MNKQIDIKSVVIGILITVCIVLAMGAGRSSMPRVFGRFQLVPVDQNAYIIDTSTGQVWARNNRNYQSFLTWCEPKVRQQSSVNNEAQ